MNRFASFFCLIFYTSYGLMKSNIKQKLKPNAYFGKKSCNSLKTFLNDNWIESCWWKYDSLIRNNWISNMVRE